MRKVIILVVLLVALSSNICNAESLVYVTTYDSYDFYLDADSIKTVTVDMNDIIKAKVKCLSKTPGDYQIQTFWVNKDSKQYKVAVADIYKDNKFTTTKDFRNLDWYVYFPDSDKVVTEILKRAE